MTTQNQSPTLCVLSANGMGDALVQMVLANNLARSGYRVTMFSDIGSGLNSLVSGFTLKPFPEYSVLLETLDSYDVVLYDSSGSYVRGMPTSVEGWCRQNAICFRMSDAPPRHLDVTEQAIAARLPDDWKHQASVLKKLNATFRGKYHGFYRPPVVEQLVSYLTEQVGFIDVQTSNGLLNTRKATDLKKILIHPTSSNERKNWPSTKFIALAKELKSQGYKPVITVAPNERDDWIALAEGEVDVPLFDSLEPLANFYMDAALFVGNDSGNGHLASCLGIPTIQLFSGWKTFPAWRAGWGENTVVVADFPYNLIKKKWKQGISVDKVVKLIKAHLN